MFMLLLCGLKIPGQTTTTPQQKLRKKVPFVCWKFFKKAQKNLNNIWFIILCLFVALWINNTFINIMCIWVKKYHINIKIKTFKLLKTFVSHVFSFQSFAFIVQEFLCFMVRWYNYAKEIIILKNCRNFLKNFWENNCTKSTVTDKINRQIKI